MSSVLPPVFADANHTASGVDFRCSVSLVTAASSALLQMAYRTARRELRMATRASSSASLGSYSPTRMQQTVYASLTVSGVELSQSPVLLIVVSPSSLRVLKRIVGQAPRQAAHVSWRVSLASCPLGRVFSGA